MDDEKISQRFWAASMMKAIMQLSMMLFCMNALTACAVNTEVTWHEDVQLSNGITVVAERIQTYDRVYDGSGVSGQLQMEKIKLRNPNSDNDIIWQGEGVSALSLDVDARGEVYLVATWTSLRGRKIYAAKGRHIAFKYSDGERWLQIPMSEVPAGMKPNLLVDSAKIFIYEKHPQNQIITLSEKKMLDGRTKFGDAYYGW